MRIYGAKVIDELLAMETDACIPWPGAPKSNGYGQIQINRKKRGAHQYVFEKVKGPIPAGSVVRHTCDHPICVNPRHLILGTYAQNSQDSVERQRHGNVVKTHCPKGHPYDSENTYVTPSTGGRKCRACRAAYMHVWQKKNPDKVRAYGQRHYQRKKSRTPDL